jgi:hypothetical protein
MDGGESFSPESDWRHALTREKNNWKIILASAMFVLLPACSLLPAGPTPIPSAPRTDPPPSTPAPETCQAPQPPRAPPAESTGTIRPDIPGGVPVISDVVLVPKKEFNGLTVYSRIYFTDSDGDVTLLEIYVVSDRNTSRIAGRKEIDLSSDKQRAGTYTSYPWRCGKGKSRMTLQAVLTDHAGHRSAPYEFDITCNAG